MLLFFLFPFPSSKKVLLYRFPSSSWNDLFLHSITLLIKDLISFVFSFSLPQFRISWDRCFTYQQHSITVIDLTFKLRKRKTKAKQTKKEEEKMSAENISLPLLLVISAMVFVDFYFVFVFLAGVCRLRWTYLI